MPLAFLRNMWRNVFKKIDKGKVITFTTTSIVTCGGVSLLVVTLGPHLFPDQLCRKRHEAGMMGRPVPDEIQQIYFECAAKLGLKNPEKVKVFYSSKLSAVSAGSTSLPNGAVIGIPRSFLFRTEADVINSGLTLREKRIDWSSSAGHDLQRAFLTDLNHVSFTVAHEIGHLVNQDFILRAMFPLSWYFLSLVLIYRVWYARTFSQLSRHMPLLLAPFAGFLSLIFFNKFMQAILYAQEFKADEMSATCSLENCKGGIDYMTRRLYINRLLREIAESPQDSGFTETGEDMNKTTHPPRCERIRRLQRFLEENRLTCSSVPGVNNSS